MARKIEIMGVEHDVRAFLQTDIDGGFLHLGIVGGGEIHHGEAQVILSKSRTIREALSEFLNRRGGILVPGEDVHRAGYSSTIEHFIRAHPQNGVRGIVDGARDVR